PEIPDEFRFTKAWRPQKRLTRFSRGRIKESRLAALFPTLCSAESHLLLEDFSMPVSAIPGGFHTVTPGLTCKNAAAAIELYKKAFGATEISRMPSPDGRIMHAELQIGDSRLFLADEYPGM